MKTKKTTTTRTERKPEAKPDGKARKGADKPSKTKSTKKGRTPAAAEGADAPAAASETAPAGEPIAEARAEVLTETLAAPAEPAEPAAPTEPAAEEPPTPASEPSSEVAPVAEPAAGPPTEATEPRLPPVGTVIQKKSRSGAVRCECTVEPEGRIKYRNTLYTSLSGAAAAAAGDLGLTSKSLNGWAWWGLTKPARKEGAAPRGAKGENPVKALEKAFSKLRERINGLLGDDLPQDDRTKLGLAIQVCADVLTQVARSASGDGHAA